MFVAYSLNACSIGPAKESYYFIIPNSNSPYWKNFKEGIEAQASANKEAVPPTIVFADTAQKGNANWFETILAQKPRIIVMGGLATVEELRYGQMAKQEGVKVADVHSGNAPRAEAKKAGVDLVFSLVADHEAFGKRAAEFVAANKKRPNPKILIIAGSKDDLAVSNGRLNGFKDAIKNLVPGAEVMPIAYASWEAKKANSITTETLASNPDLDFIFSINDVMALAAADAVKKAGKGNQVAIIGVDGMPEARKAVQAGRMAATVAQIPYWMGVETYDKAMAAAKGTSIAKEESVPVVLITREVLDAKKEPLLQYVR